MGLDESKRPSPASALGAYVSVPFCRAKCSFCNFASGVSSPDAIEAYVTKLCHEIAAAPITAAHLQADLPLTVDTVYLGGGTPTILDISQLERLFVTIWQNFDIQCDAEITVECAPGTLTPAVIELFRRHGVNRISLGVQSFVDQEAASVGRLHNRATVLDDIARLRDAGITNLNLDLIAGLPHQAEGSWEFSVDQVVATQQCLPQRLGGVDASGQPARHADHGNRSDPRLIHAAPHVFEPVLCRRTLRRHTRPR